VRLCKLDKDTFGYHQPIFITTEDAIFDELFASTIATTWQQHRDSLALWQPLSHIPLINETTERIGTILDLGNVEEGSEDKVEEENADFAKEGNENNFEEENTADNKSSDSENSTIPSDIVKAYVKPPTDNLHIMDKSGTI